MHVANGCRLHSDCMRTDEADLSDFEARCIVLKSTKATVALVVGQSMPFVDVVANLDRSGKVRAHKS